MVVLFVSHAVKWGCEHMVQKSAQEHPVCTSWGWAPHGGNLSTHRLITIVYDSSDSSTATMLSLLSVLIRVDIRIYPWFITNYLYNIRSISTTDSDSIMIAEAKDGLFTTQLACDEPVPTVPVLIDLPNIRHWRFVWCVHCAPFSKTLQVFTTKSDQTSFVLSFSVSHAIVLLRWYLRAFPSILMLHNICICRLTCYLAKSGYFQMPQPDLWYNIVQLIAIDWSALVTWTAAVLPLWKHSPLALVDPASICQQLPARPLTLNVAALQGNQSTSAQFEPWHQISQIRKF